MTLTKGEHALLVAFLDAPQRPLSREHLLQATRLHEDIYDRSIDVQLVRLRRKLEADPSAPRIIRTRLRVHPACRIFLTGRHCTAARDPGWIRMPRYRRNHCGARGNSSAIRRRHAFTRHSMGEFDAQRGSTARRYPGASPSRHRSDTGRRHSDSTQPPRFGRAIMGRRSLGPTGATGSAEYAPARLHQGGR